MSGDRTRWQTRARSADQRRERCGSGIRRRPGQRAIPQWLGSYAEGCMSESRQPPPSAAAVFASQLALAVVTTAEERDALARQVAELQRQIEELKAATKPNGGAT